MKKLFFLLTMASFCYELSAISVKNPMVIVEQSLNDQTKFDVVYSKGNLVNLKFVHFGSNLDPQAGGSIPGELIFKYTGSRLTELTLDSHHGYVSRNIIDYENHKFLTYSNEKFRSQSLVENGVYGYSLMELVSLDSENIDLSTNVFTVFYQPKNNQVTFSSSRLLLTTKIETNITIIKPEYRIDSDIEYAYYDERELGYSKLLENGFEVYTTDNLLKYKITLNDLRNDGNLQFVY